MAKRDGMSRRKCLGHPGGAPSCWPLLIGGLLCSCSRATTRSPVLRAPSSRVPWARPHGIRETVKIASSPAGHRHWPLPLAFKMKFWNIGAEGQITGRRHVRRLLRPSSGPTISPRSRCLLLMCARRRPRRRPVGLLPAYLQGPVGHQRDPVHPDDEPHRHRHRQVPPWAAPGRHRSRRSHRSRMFGSERLSPQVLGVHCGWIIVLVLTVASCSSTCSTPSRAMRSPWWARARTPPGTPA
ncbi:MAG: hypothetical protein ACLRWQ_01570 [Flavonifractor plautii]